MSANPVISVIIPLFNKEPYILRTLRSVQEQTLENIEIIVIDDGSTDDGAKVVSSFGDSRIRIIKQDNKGVSAARNRGAEEARADYVAFLDADDEWKPDYLTKVFALRNEFPGVKLFASATEIIRFERDKIIPRYNLPEKSLINLEQFMDICVKDRPPLYASSIIIEKQLLLGIGGFPVGQARGEDIDTWFRLLSKTPCAYINQALVIYWAGLPQSTCVVNDDIVTSSLVKELEKNVGLGKYQGERLTKIYDFLAWHQSGSIVRLIRKGEGSKARERIGLAMRSKHFRIKCIKWYLESFFTMK